MSDKDTSKLAEPNGVPALPKHDEKEGELYVEPPRMTAMDTIGVAIAIVALLVIGWAGYLWLTPGKSVADFFSFAPKEQTKEETATADMAEMAAVTDQMAVDEHGTHAQGEGMQHMEMGDAAMGDAPMDQPMEAESQMHGADAEQQAAETSEAAASTSPQPPAFDAKTKCAECGMFVARSLAHTVGYWTNGSVTQHDSWDCLFNYGNENGLTLDHALVRHYGEGSPPPEWLQADQATFLYETKAVAGSMPPFVAAYASEGEAREAVADMGGTLMNFSELRKQW